VPGITVKGLDISSYAIKNSKQEVKRNLIVGDAREMPYPDNSFDLVVSINTVHNLDREGCKQALIEIERVSRKDTFITVDAYRTDIEKERMFDWNLTALTIMSDREWKEFFLEVEYKGDFFWFIP
jgi:ubiquinone/menaquinone biosynthesis C-methylase UbiE